MLIRGQEISSMKYTVVTLNSLEALLIDCNGKEVAHAYRTVNREWQLLSPKKDKWLATAKRKKFIANAYIRYLLKIILALDIGISSSIVGCPSILKGISSN